MENFTKMCKWSSFLATIGIVAFFGCGKVEHLEELTSKQESFVRASSLKVEGQVINPETGIPVTGAVVTTNSFTATTDNNGQFSASLDSFDDSESVKVTKEGHITYEFAVDYTRISNNATLSWTLYLPEREECIWVGPNEGAWYRFTANGTEYVVDMRRGITDDWAQVCVSQGGLAFGTGIPNAFGILGLNIETPGSPGGIIFNSPIDIRYDLATLLSNYPETPQGSPADIAQDAAIGGASSVELASILYGIDLATADGGNGGNNAITQPLVIAGFIPGNVIPGVGVTINAAFYFYQIFEDPNNTGGNGGNGGNGGTGIITSGSLFGIEGLIGGTILDDNSTDVQDIPHQGVGDGGG